MFSRFRMLISFINEVLVVSNLDISSERYEIYSFKSFYLLLFYFVSFLNKADSRSYFKARSLFLLNAIIMHFTISLNIRFILSILLNLPSLSFVYKFIPRSIPILARFFSYSSIPYEKTIRSWTVYSASYKTAFVLASDLYHSIFCLSKPSMPSLYASSIMRIFSLNSQFSSLIFEYSNSNFLNRARLTWSPCTLWGCIKWQLSFSIVDNMNNSNVFIV